MSLAGDWGWGEKPSMLDLVLEPSRLRIGSCAELSECNPAQAKPQYVLVEMLLIVASVVVQVFASLANNPNGGLP